MSEDYQCNKCGCCCRSLAGNQLFADLDRGDGICRNYDISKRLCMIYAHRPVKCNVKKYYTEYCSKKYSWTEFATLNQRACQLLRDKFK